MSECVIYEYYNKYKAIAEAELRSDLCVFSILSVPDVTFIYGHAAEFVRISLSGTFCDEQRAFSICKR
jgi:hypothetical protein